MGASVLDLYAGTGAYGLESLSRGAAQVTFVDGSPRCTAVIKENVADLGIEDAKVRIVTRDAGRALKAFEASREKFDIVFLDPPFYRGLARKCLKMLSIYDILSHNNCIIVEHHRKDGLDAGEGILVKDQRRYGDTFISFFEKAALAGGGAG